MSVNGSDILAALNAGSGINAKNLAEQLVAAERAPREGVINRKLDSVTAEISGFGELSSILGALQSAARKFKGTSVISRGPVSLQRQLQWNFRLLMSWMWERMTFR